MDKNLHNDLDDFFRSELGDHKEYPSEKVWKNISADLDKNDAGASRKKFFYAKRIAAVLLLMLVSYFVYTTISNNKKEEVQEIPGTNKELKPGNGTGQKDILPHQDNDRDIVNENRQNTLTGADKPIETNPAPADDRESKAIINNKEETVKNTNTENLTSYPASSEKEKGNKKTIPNLNTPLQKDNNVSPFTAKNKETVAVSGKKSGNENINGKISETGNTRKINNGNKQTLPGNQTGIARKGNTGNINTRNNRISIPEENGTEAVPGRPFVIPADLYIASINGFPGAADTASGLLIDPLQLNKAFKRQSLFHPSWTFTASIAGNVPSVFVKDKDGNSSTGQIRELEENENEEPSPAAGILANYQFSRKFAVQSGLLYTATSINLNGQKAYAATQPGGAINYKVNLTSGYALIKSNSSTPPVVGDSIRLQESHSYLNYIGIPVLLRYTPRMGKVSITPGIGVAANMLLSATLETELHGSSGEQEYKTKLNGLRKAYLGFLLNADIRYTINKRMSLSLIPGFQYALTPITKDTGLKTYPYSVGAGIGFNISL